MNKKTVLILLTTLLGMNICFPGWVEKEVLATSETTDATETSQVLLDQDGIYVEYRGIVEHSSDSWIVNLYVENNTQNDFYLSLRNVVINGCYCSLSNSGTTIQTGSKYLAEPNFNFVLDTDKLSAYGISEITDIDFDINISTEMFGDEILNSPASIDNINKQCTVEMSEITPEKELLNQDDVHVQYCGISDYSSSSKIVNLYIENNRDSAICVSLSDVLINGYNINLSNNNAPVPAHTKFLAFPNFELIIDTDDLEAYGISEINTITGNLKIKTSMFGDIISETPVDLTKNESTEAATEEATTTDTAEASTSFSPIKKGDNSDTVKQMQNILINTGYLSGSADGSFGNMTEEAVKKFQKDNGLEATGIIDEKTYSALAEKNNSNEETSDNTIDGLSLDENEWESWESTNVCSLFPFMEAGDKAGYTFSLPSGQQESHKIGVFDFIDGGSTRALDQTDFYYGVENQRIIYTGLSTDNETVYNSADFREACIRLMLGYNIHYDSQSEDVVLNLTRERAEQIVNYCFDNNVSHCTVDGMRIRLLRNETGDNYYSFHMEY